MTLHQQMTHCVHGQTGTTGVTTLLDWYITSIDPCPLPYSPLDNVPPFLIPIHTAHVHTHVFVCQTSRGTIPMLLVQAFL